MIAYRTTPPHKRTNGPAARWSQGRFGGGRDEAPSEKESSILNNTFELCRIAAYLNEALGWIRNAPAYASTLLRFSLVVLFKSKMRHPSDSRTLPTTAVTLICQVTVFTALSFAVFAGENLHAQSPRDQEFLASLRIEKDIVYKTVKGERLDLWIFLPKEKPQDPMPVMLYTHGGGWGGGDKFKILKSAFRGTLTRLLNAGVACAAIEYRLTREGISTAIDSVEDCKDAARFLVANSEDYHLDPKRMGVWGGSAGGHLALMTGLAENSSFTGDNDLATQDPQFRCIVAYFPATTFLRPELLKGSSFERPQRMVPMIGGLASEFPDRAELLSPTRHLRQDSPPILLLHGDKDSVLPIALSEHFVGVGKEVGASVEFIVVKGGEHGFRGDITPGIDEINERVATFLLSHLSTSTKKHE